MNDRKIIQKANEQNLQNGRNNRSTNSQNNEQQKLAGNQKINN